MVLNTRSQALARVDGRRALSLPSKRRYEDNPSESEGLEHGHYTKSHRLTEEQAQKWVNLRKAKE